MRFVTFCGHLVALNPALATSGNPLALGFTIIATLFHALNVHE
ncbi:NADH-quinone oxidoreductase subunit K [Mobiluncus mulieris]|uniref:Uncharacterized protein n=2 Tax=Mobiluncus mulieris TaxID=2052 RepID=E0QTX8_9ACTO|nr:hypothetical protein HMPREF0577_1703 [Mobiluncus mulieris ATCC 35243]EFM44979.1 hypothetical protein HMPREF0580_2343 [Mobiluncus mulieris ATCC 35239]MCU9968482.1 NADH-quinone oxidoreductase subunit K [Mobiluncus mulieris]MCU9972714.1 NADH-quinone oxidoreductase subunit K [Mobiluncus mulieris]MCU9975206.1 NADH-quinone oxidoreductase subunit K [Mobiluncus mulieris]